MRISDTLRKNKKNFVTYIILWLIAVIVFVMPISVGIVEATTKGELDLWNCTSISLEYIQQPFSTMDMVFTEEYYATFMDLLVKFSIACIILVTIGTIRNASRSEYEKIEHGSSDWSKNGEQYKVLSKNKGIILAENNYLPLDKRGNTNVLVVGRFRYW